MHHCIGLGDARIYTFVYALSLIIFLKQGALLLPSAQINSRITMGAVDKTLYISQWQLREQAFVSMPLFSPPYKNNSLVLN